MLTVQPTNRVQLSESLAEQRDTFAPIIGWEDFLSTFFRWEQGQHVALIGPTDCGKTTLALALLRLRKYVTVTATKPRDDVLKIFGTVAGFRKYEEWDPEVNPLFVPRRLLWPNARSLYAALAQRKAFRAAFADIYEKGGWTLYIDELWFICKHLKLEFEIRTFLLQSRSNKVTLVVATQRPAWVPLEIYDMSRWLFFWRDNDETNLKRISGVAWLSSNLVRSIVARLEPHQCLVINTRTGEMVRTTAPFGG